MRKKTTIIIFLSFIINYSFAQRDLFLFGGLEYGIPISTYSQNKSMLNSTWKSHNLGFNASAHYRLWNRLGFELGLNYHREHLNLEDKNFSLRHPGFEANLKTNNNYLGTFGLIQYHQPINSVLGLYFNLGYGLNWVGTGTKSNSATYVANQEKVNLQNNYFNNTNIFGEIGFEGVLADENVLAVGIKYSMGNSAMSVGNYTTTKNDVVLTQDQLSSFGSYVGLTIKYGFRLHHKESPSLEDEDESLIPIERPTDIVPQPKKKIKPPKNTNIPQTVEGRTVEVAKKMKVKSEEVTIKIWDHQLVDGDIISINLNGVWIIEKYTLEKTVKEIKVKLQPGTNYLVLHAHNLGKYAPNTAAFTVDDGIKTNTVVLKSNLEQSGTIEIDFNK